MKKICLTLAVAALALAGCSKTNTYAAAAGASGEDVFKAACAECHKKNDNGKIFELASDKANATFVSKKVTEGGVIMPSFPNSRARNWQA